MALSAAASATSTMKALLSGAVYALAGMVNPHWQPPNSWWVLGPTTSGQQSSDSKLLLPLKREMGTSPPLLHPSESRHSPIVTRLPPGGQDHKILGLGITTQGRADDMVDSIIFIYPLYQLHTPVGRLESEPGSHSSFPVG